MYKDVWKRFGVKVLIILCSVLLLGGVAIAAPRLTADGSKEDLAAAITAGRFKVSGDVVYSLDRNQFNADGTPKNPNGPVGNVAIPASFQYRKDDTSPWIDAGNIEVKTTGANTDSYRDYSAKKTVYLVISSDSSNANFNKTPDEGVEFEYDVKRGAFTSLSNISITPTEHEVEGAYPVLKGEDLTVKVTYNGTEYTLPKNEIVFDSSKDPITQAGPKTYDVAFKNFTSGNVDAEGRALRSVTFTMKKHVKNLKAYINNVEITSESTFSKDDLAALTNNDIVIRDGLVELWPVSGGTQKVTAELTMGGQRPSITITEKDSSTGYYGDHTIEFKYTQSGDSFVLPRDGSFPRIIDYNDKKTYIQKPTKLESRKNPGNYYYPSTHFEVCGDDGFEFVEQNNSSELVPKEYNPTAGRVRFTVTGVGDMAGSGDTLEYRVFRRLAAPAGDDNSNVSTSAEVKILNEGYTYNPRTTYEPQLKVYFPDASGESILRETDYKVSYKRFDETDYEMKPITGKPKNAGQYQVVVEGTGSDTDGGYIESVTKNFTINPKTYDDENYKLLLKGQYQTEEIAEFDFTDAIPDLSRAVVVNKNDDVMDDINQERGNYDIVITKNGVEMDPKGQFPIGNDYEITYTFRGNYKGTLTAPFHITSYPLNRCDIVFKDCDHRDTNGNKDHIYDGTPHDPDIEVWYGDKKISEGAYKKEYKRKDGTKTDNVNAGRVYITVTSTTNDKDLTEASFIIQPRTLKDPKLSIEDFPNNSIDYQGPNYPDLKTVTMNGIEKPLEKDKDYTVGGLYYWDDNAAADADGNKYVAVSNDTYPRSDLKYAFKIKGVTNYQGEAFTNQFSILPKDIADASVTPEIADKPKSNKHSNEYYVITEGALKVYDSKFGSSGKGTLLIRDKDYEIKNINPQGEDNLDINGLVTVTIKGIGCYRGERNITYHYGDPLSGLSLYRNEKELKPNADGSYTLPGKFVKVDKSVTNSGYSDINYLKRGTSGDFCDRRKSIYLMDGRTVLYHGEDKEDNFTVSVLEEDLNDGDGERLVTLTIIGRNGYWGEKRITFIVEKDKIQSAEIAPGMEYQYTGFPIYPELVVKNNKNELLQENRDYTVVDWGSNTNAGTTTITIAGRGNYEGKKEIPFTIQKRDIKDALTNGLFEIIYNSKVDFAYTTLHNEQKPNGQPDNRDGACPHVDIVFRHKGNSSTESVEMKEYEDFEVAYYNNVNAWVVEDHENDTNGQPNIVVKSLMSSNYTGQFRLTYQIAKIPLDQCDVTLTPPYATFNGSERRPEKVTVKYKGLTLKAEEYECSYTDNIYVQYALATRGVVEILPNKNKQGNSNCSSNKKVDFIIKGSLNRTNPESGAKENSYVVTEPGTVAYDKLGKEPYLSGASFYQKKAGDPTFIRREMIQDIDYRVRYNLSAATVGKQYISIEGINDFTDIYSGGEDKDGNMQECYFYLQGNLSDPSQTTYTKPPAVITYVSGSSLDLSEMISPVRCGGKVLEYGVDYEFIGDPTFSIGLHQVTVIPAGEGKNYLTGEINLEYEVKQGIDGVNISVGDRDTYEYNHGLPVVTEKDIKVTMNGKPLTQGVHYNVSFRDGNNVNVTATSGAAVIIEGIGDYGGTTEKEFTIKPYDLGEHEKAGDLVVDDDPAVSYTGSEVFPAINHINVTTVKYGPIDLTEKKPDVEYRQVGAGDGDRINYTRPNAVKPRYQIRPATNNYTGYIEREYSITKKDITSEGVDFEKITDQKYLNGREIKPVPNITYAGRQLTKLPYSIDTDYSNSDADFTYEYETDCRNVNSHTIRIRGIGNFTGDTRIEFNIIPKNIEEEDVELSFTGEPLVYNGQKQIPAFELKYAGDTILSYNGTSAAYLIMKGAHIDAEHNQNANDGATLTIEAADPNYTGRKVVSFKINPASLEEHTRFVYQLNAEERVDLSSYKLNLPFGDDEGNPVARIPEHAATAETLAESQIGTYYSDVRSANNGAFLSEIVDYDIERMYVEPDTEDVEIREEYRADKQKPPFSWAGKVMVTITGKGNYTGSARYWYYIGTDISTDASIRMEPTSVVYNSQKQVPVVTVSGVEEGRYNIAKYKDKVDLKNLIQDKDFVNAGTYYIRIEGNPSKGTYATKPHTLTYTITPRPISNSVVIDGFKKEYPYTGLEIRPVGISVTDYIDRIKYRLTEDLDYTLSYSNNLNAGTAFINIEGKNNFKGTARANFLITSSTISSGSSTTPNTPINGGTGEISGSKAISPSDVILTMDTANAMHYTGNPVYPKVSIAGMTENVDYTVTFSNNTEVGTATVTITGIGNNRGTITKTFNIIAPLSNCKIAEIPAQQYTGSAVEPTLTVTCGKNILIPGTDYNVTYANNINIGTATATIRAASNSKYTGSASVTFSIANDVGDFIISGYAPTYTYTGNAITPSVVVETGSGRLTQGTDYTISYSNNINAGKATITVKGVGRYSGTKTATFIIEAKNIQGCTTTEVEDRTYTGDAYTPTITVTDGNKVLTSGVDYTVTYTNNTEPGTASILIQGMSNNYSGTKVVTFKIGAVAVKGLKATKVKYNSLKLKWTKQGYADGYQICDAQSKVVKNVTKNSVTLKKLATGKTYRYKVRSYIRNADGTRSYGAFSSVVSATTKLKTPEVEIVSKKTGQARITWSKVSGANGYEIYYKKSSGETYRKVKTVNNANVRLCRVRGMKSGDKAYFRVRAFKKTGSKKVYSSMNKLKVITVK